LKKFAAFIGEERALDAAPGADLAVPSDHAIDNDGVTLHFCVLKDYGIDYSHALMNFCIGSYRNIRTKHGRGMDLGGRVDETVSKDLVLKEIIWLE